MAIQFDESYYLSSKVNSLNHNQTGTTWTVSSLSQALANAGLTSLQHYEKYGAYEVGVNANAGFDDELYCADKAKELNSISYGGKITWGVDEVENIFKSLGISPLDHYNLYGIQEGLTPKQSQTLTLADTTSDSKTIVGALYSGGSTWNDLLIGGQAVVYYGFMSSKSDTKDGSWENMSNFVPMDSKQQAAAKYSLAEVSRVTGITFYQTADTTKADILFGTGTLGKNLAGQAYFPYYNPTTGHLVSSIMIDNKQYHSMDPVSDTQWYEVLLHEDGHAMSLKHPFEGSVTLPKTQDNTGNTLMSYTDSPSGPFNTYRPLDILALQYIYGQDGIGGMGMSTWA